MKLTDVTELQQSKEFVIATNLETVNYGKNVGPDLVGTGGIGGRDLWNLGERPSISY